MIILALDLARRFGWALYAPNRPIRYGSCELPETGDDLGWYLDAYCEWLDAKLRRERPVLCCYETPWIGPKTRQEVARKLMAQAGATELVCRRLGIKKCQEESNSVVRHAFVGAAPARFKRDELKAMVVTGCEQRGWQPRNDDEADALALLDYAMNLNAVPGAIAGPLLGPLARKGLENG